MSKISPDTRPLSNRLSGMKRPVLWAAIAMIGAIYLRGIITGQFGKVGVDGDDVMRLIQIQDYLAGQSWFDTDQLRLGLAGGTDMHWSRLVDLPIIILTHFFDIFTHQDRALSLAISIWPPLTAAIFIFAIAKAAKYYADMTDALNTPHIASASFKTAQAFTLILLGFFTVQFFRFEPGAIDHHNVQMGLVALSMTGAIDPRARFRPHFISGLAAALSVAIGTEVYIFAGIICAYVAVNWLVRGEPARRAAQGFGLGLSLALTAAFFATIMPDEYLTVKCDSLSLITLSAGLAGGLGLAFAAQMFSRGSFKSRAVAVAAIGALCLIVFAVQGPQCMANPLASLPDDVKRLWLDEVQEARPIWNVGREWLAIIPLTLGPAGLGMCVLGRQLQKDAAWSPRWLIMALLIAATLLSLYQVRFNIFSYVFALMPLAAWVAGLYARGKAKADSSEDNASNVGYIGALALSIPLVWLLPAAIAQSGAPADQGRDAAAQINACYSAPVMDALKGLPLGTIASTSDGGVQILLKTQHRSLSGNYHRNLDGISAQIHLATSVPQTAYDIMSRAGVDYVHFCKASPETESLVSENDDGLYARLKRGDVPDYLLPALVMDEGNVVIYKVDRQY